MDRHIPPYIKQDRGPVLWRRRQDPIKKCVALNEKMSRARNSQNTKVQRTCMWIENTEKNDERKDEDRFTVTDDHKLKVEDSGAQTMKITTLHAPSA